MNHNEQQLSKLYRTTFWLHVYNNSKQEGDCRIWTGASNSSRYPVIRRFGKLTLVHKEIMYFLNPFYKGVVKRSCKNRLCCNPNHITGGKYSRSSPAPRHRIPTPSPFDQYTSIKYSPVVILNGERLYPELTYSNLSDAVNARKQIMLKHKIPISKSEKKIMEDMKAHGRNIRNTEKRNASKLL